MADITLRNVKGSPLTNAEVDANFNNINNEVSTKLDTSAYTATDVVSKVKSIQVSQADINVNRLNGLSSTNVNTVSTIVARDSNGDFSAGTITATTVIANLTGNVTGNLTGTVTGNASNVNGVVALTNGGTGATTAETARTALGLGNIALQNKSSIDITGGTITGLGTPLPIASGGTAASTANAARTNLGLQIGTDIQPFSNQLTTFAGLAVNGFIFRNGTTISARTLVAGANIAISNVDGSGGNPTISIPSTATPTFASVTVNGAISSTAGISSDTMDTNSLQTQGIVKKGTNGTGDIGQTNNRFATIYGTASTAKYADLAERYTTDKEYETGTVIVISLDNVGAEGTASYGANQRVLGVVSAAPAYLMNDDAPGQALALRGRVPVKIVGAVRKGETIITAPDGKGIVGDGNVFAMALHSSSDESVKLVECVIL
jgi:hypothetical protein